MCLTIHTHTAAAVIRRASVGLRAALHAGALNDFDRGEGQGGGCSFCGAEVLPKMRTRPTVRCRYSGEAVLRTRVAAARSGPKTGGSRHCDRRTPPLSAAQFAKTLRHGPSEA